MTILHALILGIIEGLTEFLPISSTFHLIFASKFLGLPDSDFVKFFEVFIQGGAILPVLIIYFREWLSDQELLKKVAVSFIPTAIVGLLLNKIIKDVFFESPLLMIGAFVVVGVVFLVLELLVKKDKIKLEKSTANLTYKDAALIGLFQAMAVLPGVSRAGAVIVGMMILGVKRDEAAKYSFTLAVPTILAASLFDLVKMHGIVSSMDMNALLPLVVGTVAAFISAFAIVQWFINFLRRNSLNVFGFYRFALAALLLLLGVGR